MAVISGRSRARAGHGYVDPVYRPPRLPFVSVVGPLSLEVEPERDVNTKAFGTFRMPGYLIGRPRAATDALAGAGNLKLRFDGVAILNITGLPAGNFGSATYGTTLATAINTAIAAANFRDVKNAVFTEPTELASLTAATARFDTDTQQLAICSGLGAAINNNRSTVEILTAASPDASVALGFVPPAASQMGMTFKQALDPPKAFAVDVRVDLWAATQGELASMMDSLAQTVPTRGRLLIRPGLLAADVKDGDTTIRLLSQGEPSTGDSMLHVEAADGFYDRMQQRAFITTAGATTTANPPSLNFTGTGTARLRVHPTPLIPDPRHSDIPAPRGVAIACGFTITGGANNNRVRIYSLELNGQPVLRLECLIVQVSSVLFGELIATAGFTVGAAVQTTETHWRIPLTTLNAGIVLHAAVEGPLGQVALFMNGDPQQLGDPAATPVAPVPVVGGTPLNAWDMVLTLGNGAGNVLPIQLTHVHVFDEPFSPLDPNVRAATTAASEVSPGDPIVLTYSTDGFSPSEQAFQTMVASVSGDTVTLVDKVVGSWNRNTTLVYQQEYFFFQRQLRRKDDLMNHLFRCSIDYRVSGMLDEPNAMDTAPLVVQPVVDLTALGATRVPGFHPGSRATEP
jgi:hypothetical protein